MALPSDRNNSRVDPSKGIYVEMEGVVEVRWASEDIDLLPESEDLYNFQHRETYIPEDFCLKDKQTTLQAYFFCLVCMCELKSLKTMKDHILGNKHIQKALEKKRIIFDLPAQPKNAPRSKNLKRPQPQIDLNKSLKERLEDSAQPVTGLQFIEEYINPSDKTAHRMYSCKLDGCKSAWGNSDDMYNHVIQILHAKNYFKVMYPEDSRINGLNKSQVLEKVAKLNDDEETDYNMITRVKDYQSYVDMRDRPNDWSERKHKKALMESGGHSNLEPRASGSVIVRKEDQKYRRDDESPWDHRKHRVDDESPFVEEMWENWRPISPRTRYKNWMDSVRKVARTTLQDAEEFEGHGRESPEYKEAMEVITNQRTMIDLDRESGPCPPEIEDVYAQWVDEMMAKFGKAEELLNEKADGGEREMKHIGKLLTEVEEEMLRYHGSRDSRKYKTIQSRMAEITRELNSMNPSTPYRKSRKDDFNNRLGNLWKQFEENSDDKELARSSLLERQMKDVDSRGLSR